MREVNSSLQLVNAIKMLWTGLIDLLPFDSITLPILLVEEPAFSGLYQKALWISAVGQHVSVEALVAYL